VAFIFLFNLAKQGKKGAKKYTYAKGVKRKGAKKRRWLRHTIYFIFIIFSF